MNIQIRFISCRIGRLLDFVENKNHRSTSGSHQNGFVPTFVPASFRDDSLQSNELSNNNENFVELGDNNQFYAINRKNEYNLSNDYPSGGANQVLQEFNERIDA